MTRSYQLRVTPTEGQADSSTHRSWRSIQIYLLQNRSYSSISEPELSDDLFIEQFRQGLPKKFSDKIVSELRSRLNSAVPDRRRFGPFEDEVYFELLETLRDLRKRNRSNSDERRTGSEELLLALLSKYVLDDAANTEPEGVARLRNAIAASASVCLRVQSVRLGSIEAQLQIAGFEEFQKQLKLDVPGLDAFFDVCVTAAVIDHFNLKEGAVSVTFTPDTNNLVETSIETNAPIPGPSQSSFDQSKEWSDFLSGWAKKLVAAAIFPVALAILVGGAIVYQFDKVDSSRQKFAEQQIDLLKQETERRKNEASEATKFQAALTDEWRKLFEASAKVKK